MENAVILFEGVDIYQSGNCILNQVNVQMGEGEFIYLIGRTGTGKSTLMKTLYGDLLVSSGSAQVCGYDLRNLKRKDIPYLRRKIGIVFQDFQLLFDRTVRANLEFVLKATGWENRESIETRIREVMNEVGLIGQEGKMPFQLSGGEQQRLVIARALLNNPMLVIADEPTGNLDPETSDEIMRLLIRINREHNTAVLMATHNYQIIDKYPSRIFNCSQGTVLQEKGIYVKV